ncbi:hypothetical protein FE257_006859, partial [Aspergillus nanangensis]
MSFRNLSQDIVSGSTRYLLQGGKIVVSYAKPALDKSTELTVQAAIWGSQNPIVATCVVASTTGAVLFAAPGLATAPLLSSMGFTAGGIQAGSVAAATHSWTGNIAAGSAMAVGQSAGTGGSGLVIFNGIAQLGGAAMAPAADAYSDWCREVDRHGSGVVVPTEVLRFADALTPLERLDPGRDEILVPESGVAH